MATCRPCRLNNAANGRMKLSLHLDSLYDETLAVKHNATALEPFLLIGGDDICSDKAALKAEGVTHIVNCTTRTPNFYHDDFAYLRIPLGDHPSEDISGWFGATNAHIEAARRTGGACLVHCNAGMSRSVALVLAYLMRYEKMSLLAAFELCKAKRPQSSPNIGFMAQLLVYEQQLFNRITLDKEKYEFDRFARAETLVIEAS